MLLVRASLPNVICWTHQILLGNAPLGCHYIGGPEIFFYKGSAFLRDGTNSVEPAFSGAIPAPFPANI